MTATMVIELNPCAQIKLKKGARENGKEINDRGRQRASRILTLFISF